jgi:3-dehydroquinate synthase
VQALLDLHLPVYDSALESNTVFEGLEEFRQHLGGRLTLTMLKSLGHVQTVHEVNQQVMEQAIDWLSEIHAKQYALQPS